MGKLAGWLIAGIVSAFGQIITSLGIGAVTYVALDLTLNQFKGLILNHYNGLPVDVIKLLGLVDFGGSVAIVFGAYASVIALKQARAAIGRIGAKKG